MNVTILVSLACVLWLGFESMVVSVTDWFVMRREKHEGNVLSQATLDLDGIT